MLHTQDITCAHCHGKDVVKNGKDLSGTQCWQCKGCKKYFRLSYKYNACQQGIKQKIIKLTLNSSGVRDIGRVLRINKNTVISVLKKNFQNEPLFSYYTRKKQYAKLSRRDKMQQ